jgi:hypothetical protein
LGSHLFDDAWTGYYISNNSSSHYDGTAMALTGYLYERKQGIARTAGVMGGLYVVGRYVAQRLDTMRTSFVEERVAQDK